MPLVSYFISESLTKAIVFCQTNSSSESTVQGSSPALLFVRQLNKPKATFVEVELSRICIAVALKVDKKLAKDFFGKKNNTEDAFGVLTP